MRAMCGGLQFCGECRYTPWGRLLHMNTCMPSSIYFVRQCAGYASVSGPFPPPKRGRPVYIAIVDTATHADVIELVKLALAAALEALPASALFGLITVSDTV